MPQHQHCALLQSVAEIGTQRTMKSKRKTLHELSPRIPQKTPKGKVVRRTKCCIRT
jgi:hypothetical protein